MEFAAVLEDPQARRVELRKQLDALLGQRTVLEIEADAIHSELTSPGANGERPAGIKDSLVDEEGFPRADIDVYNVRHKRHRLAEINYDHKALMKRIEDLSQQIWMLIPDNPESRSTVSSRRSEEDAAAAIEELAEDPVQLLPIATLDEVLADSPAIAAGVRNSDVLVKFGHITSSTPSVMQAIAKLVGESVNKAIPIIIRRSGSEENVQLILTPRPWGGRGLLGCHLSPIK